MTAAQTSNGDRAAANIALSVILPTVGRPTLRRTLTSIKSQRGGTTDVEVVVVADQGDSAPRQIFAEEAAGQPLWRFVEHAPTSGGFGYPQRAHGITVANGSYLLFIDDDDVYTPGAFAKIRSAAAAHPGRILIFRMDIQGIIRWKSPLLHQGNVGMEMVAIPNVPDQLGAFRPPLRYESDFDFIVETVAVQGDPVWQRDVIVIFNQPLQLERPRTGGLLSRLLFQARTGNLFSPLRVRLRTGTRARSMRSRLGRAKEGDPASGSP